MQNELFIAALAGLGGMIGWGLADLFAKKTIDEVGDTVTLAWGHIFGSIALLIALVWRFAANDSGALVPHSADAWLFLIFFGILQAAVYLLVYRGFGKGQVAVLNPVFASFAGITSILSIVFFREAVSGYLGIGLLVIFSGILLINLDIDALKTKQFGFLRIPGMKEIAIATILASIWTLFWDQLVVGNDWLSYTFYMYLFMTIAILLFARFSKISLSITKPQAWKYLVLIGICEIGGYLAISWGYSMTSNTSVVALLSGGFSLPTIFLARIFLKERVKLSQTIGGLIIVVGIMLIYLL